MKIISTNKKVNMNYEVLKKFECGVQLVGSEVKSIRNDGLNIKDAYVVFKDNQASVIGMHIAEYSHGNRNNHETTRSRKILLHKAEIIKIQHWMKVDSLVCVVTKAYFLNGLIKLEIATAKSKNKVDKRYDLKAKSMERDAAKRVARF